MSPTPKKKAAASPAGRSARPKSTRSSGRAGSASRQPAKGDARTRKTPAAGRTAQAVRVMPRGLLTGGRRVGRLVGWLVLAGAAGLAAVPALISLTTPANPDLTVAVSEQALCQRRCKTDSQSCLLTAGNYPPSIERCEVQLDVCSQMCAPKAPPKPQPMTLRRCADLYCKPAETACQVAAGNDAERSDCEVQMLDCLTECRDAIRTGVPMSMPQELMGARPAGGQQYPESAGTALAKAKSAVNNLSGQLSAIRDKVDSLDRQGLKAPDQLTEALDRADDLAAQVSAAQSYDDLRGLDLETEMKAVAEGVNRHLLTVERLASLTVIYRQVNSQLNSLAGHLQSDRELLDSQPTTDLDRAIEDFSDLLETAQSSLAQAQAQIKAGQSASGLDVLETEVVDNIREMTAIHVAINWTLNPASSIISIQNDLSVDRQSVSWLKSEGRDLTSAEAFLGEKEAKLIEMKKAASADSFDAPAFYVMAKELIDLDELYELALNASRGLYELSLMDSANVSLPSVTVPRL